MRTLVLPKEKPDDVVIVHVEAFLSWRARLEVLFSGRAHVSVRTPVDVVIDEPRNYVLCHKTESSFTTEFPWTRWLRARSAKPMSAPMALTGEGSH